MPQIREYVLGILAAAMICGIVLCFAEKSKEGPLLKLICGLVLTFSLVEPILNVRSGDWESLGIDFQADAKEAAEEGKALGENKVRMLIKQETEAYIMDKARDMDLHIRVEVILSDQALPTPEAVTITGTLPPYGKAKLSRMLQEELGIPRENQTWIS